MCVSKLSDDLLHNKPFIFSKYVPTSISRDRSSSETFSSTASSTSLCESVKSVSKKGLIRKDSEIRCKYLHKLGIFPDRSPSSTGRCEKNSASPKILHSPEGSNLTHSRIKENTFFLKTLMLHPVRPRHRVTFHNMVEVHLIPNKSMYSQKVRENLWNHPEDICRNAVRNSVEFAAENFDWRQAVEDENFLVSPSTGARIHPAHLHWLDYVPAQRRQQNYQVQF